MKKPVLRKGATIRITGREWFDKVNGNSYHAVHIYVKNGNVEHFLISPPTYGYGEHYLQTAWTLIWKRYVPCKGCQEKLPYIPRTAFSWQLKDFYNFSDTFTAVARKKDLAFS